MDTTIEQRVNAWLQGDFDPETKAAVKDLKDNHPDEMKEAFYRTLEFGTGGLRGIMGVGTNRMNQYTVGIATQGFANYLKEQFPGQEVRVAIAHDSRNNSRKFAEITANVFAANGIKVFLFEKLRPTPELSFAIRYLHCQGGVVCTASIIQKNTTDIKPIGMTEASWCLPMIKMSSMKSITLNPSMTSNGVGASLI